MLKPRLKHFSAVFPLYIVFLDLWLNYCFASTGSEARGWRQAVDSNSGERLLHVHRPMIVFSFDISTPLPEPSVAMPVCCMALCIIAKFVDISCLMFYVYRSPTHLFGLKRVYFVMSHAPVWDVSLCLHALILTPVSANPNSLIGFPQYDFQMWHNSAKSGTVLLILGLYWYPCWLWCLYHL